LDFYNCWGAAKTKTSGTINAFDHGTCTDKTTYSISTKELCIPAVYAQGNNAAFRVIMKYVSGTEFQLVSAVAAVSLGSDAAEGSCADRVIFDLMAKSLCLSDLYEEGSKNIYSITMRYISGSKFQLLAATPYKRKSN
jgi:hypothetical protein